jgi:hypothetical protein
VRIHRAGAWRGWRWLDRLEDLVGDLAMPLVLLTAVPAAWNRLAYRLRRRTDWEVLVSEGRAPVYRPDLAVLLERLPTKAAAEARAEVVWSQLDRDGTLPTSPVLS